MVDAGDVVAVVLGAFVEGAIVDAVVANVPCVVFEVSAAVPLIAAGEVGGVWGSVWFFRVWEVAEGEEADVAVFEGVAGVYDGGDEDFSGGEEAEGV